MKQNGIRKFQRAALGLGLIAALIVGGAACGPDTKTEVIEKQVPSGSTLAFSYVVAVNTNYAAGSASLTKLDSSHDFPVLKNAAFDSDPGGMDLVYLEGRPLAYLTGREGDVVKVMDPMAGMAVLDSFTVGAGLWAENPQDVLAVSATKAYVTRYGSDDILIVNLETGAKTGHITFPGVATNADHLARPADMTLARGKVFVALQNLDAGFNFGAATVENGIIAVMDPNTDAVLTTITLARANPQRLVYSPELNQILVACAGLFSGAGGLPLQDRSGLVLVGADSPYTKRVVISGENPDVDGNIFDVSTAFGRSAYVLVADGFANADRALEIDLSAGTVNQSFRYPAQPTALDDLAGIVISPDFYLVIGDRANSRLIFHDLLLNAAAGYADLAVPPMGLMSFIP